MAKKTFKIRAKFVFGGQVQIKAHNRQEAEAEVERSSAAVLGKVEAQSEDIVDWDFCSHGETIINRKQEEDEV